MRPIDKEQLNKMNIIRNPPEVKSVGKLLQIYFYSKKSGGYHCLGLTIENAIDFFKQIKKACASEHEVLNVPIFTQMMDSKGKMMFYKEELEIIRPLLANELNYRTGKKERPPDLNKPDWRKIIGQIEEPREKNDENKNKEKQEISKEDKNKYIRQRKQKKGS